MTKMVEVTLTPDGDVYIKNIKMDNEVGVTLNNAGNWERKDAVKASAFSNNSDPYFAFGDDRK